MSKSLVLALLFAGVSCAGWAQTDRIALERAHQGPADKGSANKSSADKGRPDKTTTTTADDLQHRRAAVRAALEAQREQKIPDSDTSPRVRRQLSPQERQELRRQLRQQTG